MPAIKHISLSLAPTDDYYLTFGIISSLFNIYYLFMSLNNIITSFAPISSLLLPVSYIRIDVYGNNLFSQKHAILTLLHLFMHSPAIRFIININIITLGMKIFLENNFIIQIIFYSMVSQNTFCNVKEMNC